MTFLYTCIHIFVYLFCYFLTLVRSQWSVRLRSFSWRVSFVWHANKRKSNIHEEKKLSRFSIMSLDLRINNHVEFLVYQSLTPLYMGFWRYVITWEGIKTIPPIKIHQNDSNLVKRHVLAKIDYCCPLFMHLELNYYHFWPQKGPKYRCIFTRIEGSPLWLVYGKNCRRKIFWKFQKEISKMAYPGPF